MIEEEEEEEEMSSEKREGGDQKRWWEVERNGIYRMRKEQKEYGIERERENDLMDMTMGWTRREMFRDGMEKRERERERRDRWNDEEEKGIYMEKIRGGDEVTVEKWEDNKVNWEDEVELLNWRRSEDEERRMVYW